MIKLLATICVALLAVGTMACGAFDEDGTTGGEDTGIVMGLQLPTETDVTHMRYSIYERDCPPPEFPYGVGEVDDPQGLIAQKTLDLSAATLPGGFAEFLNEPFDADSAHQFADLLLLVPPGCYQVHIQPMAGEDELSNQCLAVYTTLEVFENLMTEELLISQCQYE
jgi:hypothetical protein